MEVLLPAFDRFSKSILGTVSAVSSSTKKKVHFNRFMNCFKKNNSLNCNDRDLGLYQRDHKNAIMVHILYRDSNGRRDLDTQHLD